MDKELMDVRLFQATFGMPNNERPTFMNKKQAEARVKFLREEVKELEDALFLDDLAGQIDALVDIVYIAKGTVLRIGCASSWPFHWSLVQDANMRKVLADSNKGYKGLVKPPGWVKPDHKPLLYAFGWNGILLPEHERSVDPTLEEAR